MKKVLTILVGLLCPISLVRGLWLLQQPWGVNSQNFIAIFLIDVALIVSLYLFFEYKVKNAGMDRYKGRLLLKILGCAAFVFGCLFIMVSK